MSKTETSFLEAMNRNAAATAPNPTPPETTTKRGDLDQPTRQIASGGELERFTRPVAAGGEHDQSIRPAAAGGESERLTRLAASGGEHDQAARSVAGGVAHGQATQPTAAAASAPIPAPSDDGSAKRGEFEAAIQSIAAATAQRPQPQPAAQRPQLDAEPAEQPRRSTGGRPSSFKQGERAIRRNYRITELDEMALKLYLDMAPERDLSEIVRNALRTYIPADVYTTAEVMVNFKRTTLGN